MYARELHVALRLVRQAGTVALRYYRRRSRVIMKANETPVTAADRAIEWLLAEGLSRAFPDDQIVGEEHGSRGKTPGRFWTIDPIDGTNSFIHKAASFSNMVALVKGGRPVLGVIGAPAHQKVYYGMRGRGSFVMHGLRTHRLHVRKDVVQLEQAVLTILNPSYSSRARLSLSRQIRDRFPVRRRPVVGSAGLDCCSVAEGRSNVTVIATPRLGIWDTAPGQVILEEAGGVITDIVGKPLRYRWGSWGMMHGVVATTPGLLGEALQFLHSIHAPKMMQKSRNVLQRTLQK